MQTRLLAFLAETERSIRAGKSEPREGATWEILRSVNYRLGLARLALAARDPSGIVTPIGAVLLQSFKLADGNVCLRANLAWQEAGQETSLTIYAKPDLQWQAEAERVASAWLTGPVAKDAALHETTPLLAAG
ncbi:MAG TPA: hypothetical protein VGF85_03665 [Opitutaceae bacterium]